MTHLLQFSASHFAAPGIPNLFQIFVMKLNDSAPSLEEDFIKVGILETSPVGAFVAAVRASAKDNLHFSIIGENKNEGLFLVGKNTGKFCLSLYSQCATEITELRKINESLVFSYV